MCDLNSEKPEKNSKRIIIHKKGCKHEHDDDSKYANSEKSYRDFDSCEASTDEEFEDVSESSADTSKEDTKSELFFFYYLISVSHIFRCKIKF